LVFGGHPAITPLVRGIADRLDHRENVLMFQSKAFVAETDARDTVLTDAHDWNGAEVEPRSGRRNMSLLRMRYEMLGRPDSGSIVRELDRYRNRIGLQRADRLRTLEFEAAFFIGGMEGVEREFYIFRRFHPDTPAYPLASAGSAAQHLRREELSGPPRLIRLLDDETAYSLLLEHLLPSPDIETRMRVADFERPRWTREGAGAYPADEHLDPGELDGHIGGGAGGGQAG
jgi:hypothetical protein